MSTYAIGDVQGCFQPLQNLLKKIHFDPTQDRLWFTGDLVNRGPHSLQTLRFIKSLREQAITVLGNHDFALLSVATNAIPYDPRHHTFLDILQAPDCNELVEWLRHQPLIHHDKTLNYTLVHAGIYPQWDLKTALSLAKEVETVIQGYNTISFLKRLYGNKPDRWDPTLQGIERLRFIVNCFTRLRFCSKEGQLELRSKGNIETAPPGYLPWFLVPQRANHELNILFGHWAALEGKCPISNVFALDSGCVWGRCLTAMRLEDQKRFTEPCQQKL